jgi:hypothetical protein
MPSHHQTPPAESLNALTKAAESLHPSHSNMAQLLKHIHDFPGDHNPHPMYVVGLKDMATSGGLRRAIVIGWRYLSVSGSEKKFAAEVHHDSDGSNHRFAGMNHGPAVEALIRVIEDDKIREQVESHAFSLSTGAIPALDISAVWLRATNDGDDRLFVVPPAPSFLKPWPDTYTVQQLENAVQDEAARNVKLHATVFA